MSAGFLYLEEKIFWIKGLALNCPMGDEDPNCPLFEIRKLPVRERLEIIELMEPKEITGIADYHNKCLRKKEAIRFNLN